MPVKVELVPTSPKTKVATRCHWDETTQSLYYCDVYGNAAAILRYDFKENKVYSAGIDGETLIPFILPIANAKDEFAVGLGRRVGIVQWDGKSSKATLKRIAFEVDIDKCHNQFNCAKADPYGRFFGGTMRTEKLGDLFEKPHAKLYKFVKGEGLTEVFDDVFISNGMAWDEKLNKFYYIDSGKFDVKSFDYDPNTGNISNEKVVIDYSNNGKHPGFLPDGLTIDRDGNLFVTTFGNYRIYKVDPRSGKNLLEISIPSKQVTACTFGGPNLDILYVTTASVDDETETAGCLFKVEGLESKGFAGVKVNI